MPNQIESFIQRWDGTQQAERANCQSYLNELCDLLAVPRPNLASGPVGDYRYERGVTRHEPDGTTSPRYIDLYKRGCFVLEAKHFAGETPQLSFLPKSESDRRAMVRGARGWAQSMLKARGQAEAYARDLPPEEGWPPFLIVCDIGFCFDLYADFSGSGKHYAQFPDAKSFRLYLNNLRDEKIRARLAAIFTDPQSLDPSRRRVQVPREIAVYLAKLARVLETSDQPESITNIITLSVDRTFGWRLLPMP